MIGAIRKIFGLNGFGTNGSGWGRGGSGRESKNLAKSRLSFVLVQDRTGLTQDEISKFKKEMVAVIEKYFVIDETGLDVSYKRETDSTMLIINSPVVVKRQDGFKHRVGAKHTDSNSDASKIADANKISDDNKTEQKSEITSSAISNQSEKQAVGS